MRGMRVMGRGMNPRARPRILLSAGSLAENSAQASAVGTLSAVKLAAPVVFSLTDTAGGRFQLSSAALQAGATPTNYEASTAHDVTVRATGADGKVIERTFTIRVTNVNETPTDIVLSAATLNEASAQGTLVGSLTFTDPDAGATGTFTLTDNAGGRFAISGSDLVAGPVATDYDTATSHDVTVRFTDQGGLTRDETFTLTVLSVGEGGGGGDLPAPPTGFHYLINADGKYLINADGAYILADGEA